MAGFVRINSATLDLEEDSVVVECMCLVVRRSNKRESGAWAWQP